MIGPMTMLLAGTSNPCGGAPSITSVTKTTDTLGVCFGTNWYVEWTVALSSALPAGLELYWERNWNRGGWAYWQRTTGLVEGYRDANIGSNDQGSGQSTRYLQVRVSIVPTGESPPNNCDVGSNEPVTATEASRTGYNCYT